MKHFMYSINDGHIDDFDAEVAQASIHFTPLDNEISCQENKRRNIFLLGSFLYLLTVLCATVVAAHAQCGIITTVAGTGVMGYNGDGGAATSADIGLPAIMAMDSSGNLFIGSMTCHCIRKVSTYGAITTIAGTGTDGYSGDGGAATLADMSNPQGLAIDRSGNIYISNYLNDCVRKVSVSGVITTIAGTGSSGDSGDGGPATAAQFYRPYGLAVDGGGNLYISDYYNHRVRKVSASGIVTTYAGRGSYTGAGAFSGDGGPATAADICFPTGLALDRSGNLYIADWGNNRIRKVSSSGIITTVAGSGTGAFGYGGDGGQATDANLFLPEDVAVDDSGNVYIADYLNDRLRKVSSTGIITTIAGNGVAAYGGDGGPAVAAQVHGPASTVIDRVGNIFLADFKDNHVRKIATCNPLGVENTLRPPHNVLKIYPNPTDRKVNVSLANIGGTATISIIDITGKTIGVFLTNSATTTLDMSQYPTGEYILRVQTGEEMLEEKVEKL